MYTPISVIHKFKEIIDMFDNIFEILLCPDKTVSPVPPGSRNTTVTCPEFTCLDGSCVPFNMVSL